MMMYSTALNLNNNNTPCTTPKTMAATYDTRAKKLPTCPPPPCRHRASVQEDEMDHENLHQQQRLSMPYFPQLASLPSSFGAAPAYSTKATAVMVTPEKQQQQRKRRSLFDLHQSSSFDTFNSGSSITNDRNMIPQLEPRPSAPIQDDAAFLSSPPSSQLSWTMAYHNQPLILENIKKWPFCR